MQGGGQGGTGGGNKEFNTNQQKINPPLTQKTPRSHLVLKLECMLVVLL